MGMLVNVTGPTRYCLGDVHSIRGIVAPERSKAMYRDEKWFLISAAKFSNDLAAT